MELGLLHSDNIHEPFYFRKLETEVLRVLEFRMSAPEVDEIEISMIQSVEKL